jgi:DNA-binding transcriptional regulator LsrR (DeoR family)
MPAQRGVTPRRITEDDYELFRELYAQNLGRNEIARQMGISTGSVTNIARRQGVRFDTTETELDEQVIGMLDGLELTIRRAAKELEDDSASDDPPGD